MRTQLCFSSASEVSTELLVVLAADAQSGKDSLAKPSPILLTTDRSIERVTAHILAQGEFRAAANETLLVHAPEGLTARRVLLVGLGKLAKIDANSLRNAAGTAVRFAKPRAIRELALALPELVLALPELVLALPDPVLALPDLAQPPPALAVRALIEGAFIGDYDPDTYRSDRLDLSINTFTVALPPDADRARLEAARAQGEIVGESQLMARSLVNEPGNKLTPTLLGQRAAEMAAAVGLGCEVHSTDKLHELMMGAFWSVSQGSDEPPALIVLRYEPERVDPAAPVLGLVGKGITFDAGGISIKPAKNMDRMKDDMAGGAAILCAMRAIALTRPRVRVIAIICAAENMPSGKAQKPGDVQTAMPLTPDKPGKTIEIINTDAEGRLVLADGLTYARQLGADHLLDVATLTGSVISALGSVQAGIFSNDEPTCERFHHALVVSGEKFWRLPLGDEYADMMKSDIADLKNSASLDADASTAAELLHVFVEETPWIHLDIAGMSWIDESKPYIAKGPTGFAVRSILEWVRSY